LKEDRIVKGNELAECFKLLEKSLGKAMIETIVYELETMYGINLNIEFSYSLSEIQSALNGLLGDSAAELMMESILKNIPKD